MNEENIKEFLTFLKRREKARKDKEIGVRYTTDPIIEKYRFTNVNKWDDRMSKLFLKRASVSKIPRAEALLTIHFPYETYLSMPLEKEDLIHFLRTTESKRTPAYLLSGESFKNTMLRLADVIEKEDFKVETIKELKGIGDFILNQYISNIRKLEGLYQDFFLAGPGTKKGFKLLFERSYKDKEDILLVRSLLIRNLPKSISIYFKEDINNVGNALCEYSKYYAIKHLGKGRTRIYEPRSV